MYVGGVRQSVAGLVGFLALVAGVGLASPAMAQIDPTATPRIGQVDATAFVAIPGTVRPELGTAVDKGEMSSARQFSELLVQLHRAPAQQAALDAFLDSLHDPRSPNFHKWLTARQFGERFGIAAKDLAAVTDYLTGHGLRVGKLTPNLVLTISGTVAQLDAAFHTRMHNYTVAGVSHFANATAMQVPAALKPLLTGPVALNDFKGRPMIAAKRKPLFTTTFNGQPAELVVPLDLQTIYNFNPVYAQGISGQGQTIVVIEDTDLFSNDDFNAFRKVLGLSRTYPSGNLSVVHPTGALACADPGVNGDDGEAAIDVEWSSAAAPNANIVLASCTQPRGASTGFGGYVAMSNMLNAVNPPKIFSVSYGESEESSGANLNLFITNLYGLAASEGVSVFTASGDEGAASSDSNRVAATHGITVSGWASSPNGVAVGGTDYGDTFLGEVAAYWSSTNGPFYNSAKSYIPEIPWNDSCASRLIYLSAGYASAVGPSGFCNSTVATSGDAYLTTASGSGGPSGCATGAAATRGVDNGTCKGYAKPSWQAVFGNPADGVRDIPDVSLFAANGVWGHYYVVCYSDTNTSRTGGDAGPCNGSPTNWAGFGGTSVSTPIMAGIQALVNQRTGQSQGNPNPIYYAIASAEYGASGSSSCNSTLGNGVAKTCVFYDLTLGDMDVNCTGTVNCYLGGGTNGALSVSDTVLEPAYSTSVGWDYASGIGSVNASNLVNNAAWGAPNGVCSAGPTLRNAAASSRIGSREDC